MRTGESLRLGDIEPLLDLALRAAGEAAPDWPEGSECLRALEARRGAVHAVDDDDEIGRDGSRLQLEQFQLPPPVSAAAADDEAGPDGNRLQLPPPAEEEKPIDAYDVMEESSEDEF